MIWLVKPGLLLVAALSVTHADAVQPHPDIRAACLNGASHGSVKWTALETSEVSSDDDFAGGYKATIFVVNGHEVGYAERPGRDGLIWRHTVIPLRRAKPLNFPPERPSSFAPLLADWSLVERQHQHYLCVNFNFDGLGRSGTFQKKHGMYLLTVPSRKDAKPELFFGVGRTP